MIIPKNSSLFMISATPIAEPAKNWPEFPGRIFAGTKLKGKKIISAPRIGIMNIKLLVPYSKKDLIPIVIIKMSASPISKPLNPEWTFNKLATTIMYKGANSSGKNPLSLRKWLNTVIPVCGIKEAIGNESTSKAKILSYLVLKLKRSSITPYKVYTVTIK